MRLIDRSSLLADTLVLHDQGMPAGLQVPWMNMKKLYSVAPAQWTLVTGMPGSGKSEFLDALLIELILPWPPSAKQFKWTPELVSWLTENYPAHGKDWCADALGVKENVVRYKASALQLKARGTSAAWKSKQKQHAGIKSFDVREI